MEPQQHSERMQKVLDKLCQEMVEYFDSGFVVVTFQEGSETKNAFIKFGNDYAIEGMVGNIHDILFSQEAEKEETWKDDDDDDDDDDDGGKKIIKKST